MTDLNEMYDNILLRLESVDTKQQKQRSREIRRKILTWIGMAKRPLTVGDLAYACAVRDEEEMMDLRQRLLHSEQDLLRKCGPLVEIVGGTLQYTHLSVREYLFLGGSGNYCIREESAHVSIATTSIALLRSSNVPHFDPDSLSEFDPRILYYFVKYWLHHASSVVTETQEPNTLSELSQAALRFFTDRSAFQSWTTTVSNTYIDGDRYVFPGSQPLHITALYGLLGTTTLLISGGADVSATADFGMTPLHWASFGGLEGAILLLINKGANALAADNVGKTPLFWASYGGHEGIARLLIGEGANASAADNEGETPLHWASCNGHQGMARLLIDKGADVLVANNQGETPLLQASRNSYQELVQLLIDQGANLLAANNNGETPLYFQLERLYEDL